MLEKDFQYYKDNQDKLLEQYDGKYIVIVNQDVVGRYDDEDVAYFDAEEKYGPGKFFLIKCEPGNESYTPRFHSRVVFS